MRAPFVGLMLALLLLGCGQTTATSPEEQAQSASGYAMGGEAARDLASTPEAPAPVPPPPAEGVVAPDAAQARPSAPNPPAGPNPVLYLAYSYQVGLELPASRLQGVMNHHVQVCQQAGPRLCQLVGSNVSGDPESYISGSVSLRAEPTWLRSFIHGLDAEADAAGGRVKTQTTQSEDLTRDIVDTEARLRAQTTLRDRLQELLRNRPGRLADLLEVEREFARVQGEIDSIQSNLAVMRTRVSMSELTLSYESGPQPVGSDTFEPLRHALANFLGIVVGGFAVIITLIAGLIPFAIVIVPIVWLLLRWRNSRGGRFFNRNKTPPAAPPPS